jgi:circadian clock protein KaiC
MTRMLDFLKGRQITVLFTALVSGKDDPEHSAAGVSSWMDAWIMLRAIESAAIRKRTLSVVKVRGMPHSNRLHELQFGPTGLRLVAPGETRE